MSHDPQAGSEVGTEKCLVIVMLALTLAIGVFCTTARAHAQDLGSPRVPVMRDPPQWKPPVSNEIVGHLLFSQLEGRSGDSGELRWDGEAWIGSDISRLWVKSEGVLENSSLSDGDHEVLYDRPIPHMRYFDVQVGVRADLDSGPSRFWSAVGIEGLAPHFFQLEPTLYVRDDGHVAGKVASSYDLKLTQRLVVQPQLEMNFYSKADSARGLGTGLADLDGGIRLRYEFHRKAAPYVGFVRANQFGGTAADARRSGDAVSHSSFVFGVRAWY